MKIPQKQKKPQWQGREELREDRGNMASQLAGYESDDDDEEMDFPDDGKRSDVESGPVAGQSNLEDAAVPCHLPERPECLSGAGDHSTEHRFTIPGTMAGTRLDQALAALLPQYSRSRLQSWVRAGAVSVDGKAVEEAKHKLRGGETVAVGLHADADRAAREGIFSPEDIPLSIVFEDDELIVIDKPAGLVVHPAAGNWSGTLLNALLHHAPQLAALPRAGIVHRLDKDTSGLLVVAKTLTAQTDLVRQLQARTVKREYLALAYGDVLSGGTVDAPIGRDPRERTRMAVVAGGKPARTHYRVRERFALCTLLECALETGRTHQIRVHLASIGHPLVGDPLYRAGQRGRGIRRTPPGTHAMSAETLPTLTAFSRQALHAVRLGLLHPANGAALYWEAPLPPDMAQLLDRLRR